MSEGELENEGEVYAAKVIGQERTAPGVKKNSEGGNCSPTLSATHNSASGPIFLPPANSLMSLSNS